MSFYTTPSRLAQAEAVNRVLIVAMNEVKFIAFGEKSAIGTRDLAGCSVVIIASAYGAILAHIPPRPIPNTSEPYAGDQNVQRLMEEVGGLYNQRRNYFPDTDTYAVFAIYNGGVALPDQKRIIEEKITQIGLQPFNSIFMLLHEIPQIKLTARFSWTRSTGPARNLSSIRKIARFRVKPSPSLSSKPSKLLKPPPVGSRVSNTGAIISGS
ncbi:hypothetical protein CC80DRAFT_490941 [Byssothecium circinans]|uniref:Uncharacterized protein n=1 Tax=Byssothecium circinans TaxID=147558 RepID=A0A6A5U5R8_9PLEO|nr:hypothetical protein CC80DRAFT_490941 [Byssothecium circinans]